jgi:aspartyl-tRNA synthetase
MMNNEKVLDVLDGLFVFLFNGLTKRFSRELEAVAQQYPFQPLKYKNPSLRLQYPQAITMLKESGVQMGDFDDLRFSYLFGCNFAAPRQREFLENW